jgi:hypothetical protein
MNAEELALVASSNPPSNSPTILSFAASTFPYGLSAPCFAAITVTFPTDMAFGSGDWPAFWATAADLQWGPEWDIQDGYNGNLGNVTPNMGQINPAGVGSGVDTGGFTVPVMPAGVPITFLSILYDDVCAYFVGINGAPAVCVGTTAGASQMQRNGVDVLWNFQFNYAVQARANAWPGTAPVGKTTWLPTTVHSVSIGTMPATYPGPGDGLTIPSLGNAIVTPPTPEPPPVSTTVPTSTPTSSVAAQLIAALAAAEDLVTMIEAIPAPATVVATGPSAAMVAAVAQAQSDLAAAQSALNSAEAEGRKNTTLAGPLYTQANTLVTKVIADLAAVQADD